MSRMRTIGLWGVLVIGMLAQSGFAQESSGDINKKSSRDDSQELRITNVADTKERLFRNQTMAAELFESARDKINLREKLETELFRELKSKLPKMQIGGIKYYFVESDRRLNEDQLLLYAIELDQQYEKWRSLQAKPKPIRDVIIAQNAHKLVSETEAEKVVRWRPGSKISYCIMRRSFGFGPQATQRYDSVVSEFRKAIKAWTSIENTSVPDFVHKSHLDNSPISDTPAGVTFAVWSVDLPDSVIASAFFPNDPEEDWNVLIDPERYFGTDLAFDRVGVLRHELGHVLGFRHEHPRSEAPLVCQTLEVFDDDVVPLGDYDPVSVMHYFCRGFNNPDQQDLNQQRRKLQLTAIDKRGVKLIYPSAGNSSGFQFLEFDPSRNTDSLVQKSSSIPMSRTELLAGRTLVNNKTLIENDEERAADPWVEPQDSAEAINNPDFYAWKLFVALNWPADIATRRADPARTFGENANTVWESWKLSSGKNDEVFLNKGADPGPWVSQQADHQLKDKQKIERKVRNFESQPLQQVRGLKMDIHTEFDDDRSPSGLNENHLNEAAYEFIRENELYNIEGQERLFTGAKMVFDQARKENRVVLPHEFKLHFPVGAKEVKAQWRRISVEDKPRYRWAEFTDIDGSKLLYGLTALHITTKDIPNWLWATFEHTDNPSRKDAESWQNPTVDSSAGPDGFPEGLGIKGTRWENYRLRGTQVDFVDSLGTPTILSNSQIETGFQQTSSCISCHARASIGPRLHNNRADNRLSIFKVELPQSNAPSILIGNVGPLPEELFVQRSKVDSITGELKYLQLDFVWSLMRAKRKSGEPIPLPEHVSFTEHIRPLFRQKDINAMKKFFDLTRYSDVSQHAEAIHAKLSDGSMPCDAPWSVQNIDLFKKWIDGGKNQ